MISRMTQALPNARYKGLPPFDERQEILCSSVDFDKYLQLLTFLKDPKSKPIVSKFNPKMCLTCWVIFTDKEKNDHLQSGGSGPNPHKHKITGTFQSMAQAEKKTILGLSRTWNKTDGEADSAGEKITKLALSQTLIDLLYPTTARAQPSSPRAVVKPTED